MATKQRVGIIGAGFSGLYAACKLAKAGLEVEVFEKNVMVGGRSQTFSSDGFLFDMGPSWYWMPDLIDNLFKELGVERSDYYQIDRLETSYQVRTKQQQKFLRRKTNSSNYSSRLKPVAGKNWRFFCAMRVLSIKSRNHYLSFRVSD